MSLHLTNLLLFPLAVLVLRGSVLATEPSIGPGVQLMPTGPILSPDGTAIAFDFIWKEGPRGGSHVAVWSLGAKQVRTLTYAQLNEAPTWSPDGRELLFTSHHPEGSGLFRVSLDSGDEEPVVFTQYEDARHKDTHFPIWSPLEHQVLFLSPIANGYDSYLLDLRDQKEQLIARGLSASAVFRHTWSLSSDGRHILYAKRGEKGNDIWLIDLVDKDHPQQRLTEGLDVVYLAPSPKTSDVLFVAKGDSKKEQSKWVLLKINATTRQPRKLFEGERAYLGFPSWSHDATLVAFVQHSNVIRLMNPETGDLISRIPIRKARAVMYPLLLKDHTIVFCDGASSIWSVDLKGKHLRQLFPPP